MKHIGIWIGMCVLFLYTLHIGQAYSEIHNDYEWTFEPKIDGSVYVKGDITIGGKASSFEFSFPEATPVENIEAREAETGKRIEVTKADKGDRIHYTLTFQGTKKEGFRFSIEFIRLEAVKEKDEVYYFVFGWESNYETSHRATVILPRNHELLYTDYLDPEEVSSRSNRIYVTFTDDVSGEESFRLATVFSQKGVQLLRKADSDFNVGLYEETKESYMEALTFYLQFPGVYNRDTVSFLLDLQNCITGCDNRRAEDRFEEAMTAFTSKNYTAAQQLFEMAQNVYQSAGNSEKYDECQDYIDQCIQILEQEQVRAEAEALFNEGIALFEQQQYVEAKAQFEEALAKYTELQDEEKIQACQEWITSCEEGPEATNGGVCMGSSLVFTALLSASHILLLRSRRR
jgi:tetratricopeptide (TPR) repeat protein